MDRIIRYFIEHKLLVYLLSIIIVAIGYLSMTSLNRQVLPNVDMQQMVIETIYPAASARDVEINVTIPIEEKVMEVDGIDKVRSISMENYSNIVVSLDPDADNLEEVKNDVRRAVDQVTDLPTAVRERPNVYDIETSWIPVIILGLSSKTLTERELRQIAVRMEKDIESLPGVSRVDKLGYRDREISVQVSPDELRRDYLTLQDIARAIQTRNIRLTGGTLESFADETSVLTLAEFQSPEEVGEVIVRSNFEGRRITVANVASILNGLTDDHFSYGVNGVPSIGLRVHKKVSADSISIMNHLNRYLDEVKHELPPALVIQKVRDSTEVTQRRLNILTNNALIGFVLLLAILITFLNLRVAFWTALGVPISLGAGMALHAATGGSMDSISLMVFILVLGMLVDDAIVVAENIHRYQEEGLPMTEAAFKGVLEVTGPIAATVSTTIVAFLPLFALGGMLGLFIKMIPIIIMGTLLGSLFESLFLLPSHLAAGGQRPAGWKERGAIIDPLFIPARRMYRSMLDWVLKRRYWALLVGLIFILGIAYVAANHLKFVLFPVEGAEEFMIHLESEAGSSYGATAEQVVQVEKLVSALPSDELLSYETWVGMDNVGMSDLRADNLALVYVRLKPFGQRRRQATAIINQLRAEAPNLKGFASVSFELDSGGPPVGRPVELNLLGDNQEVQQAAVADLLTYLKSLPGVLDPISDLKYAKDEEVLRIDYAELARLGLTVADVAGTVRLAFQGEVVSSVRFKQEEVDIRVQLEPASRRKMATLKDLQVRNQAGHLVPLGRFIQVDRKPSFQAIRHFQGQRVVTISADVDNEKTTSNEVKDQVFAYFAGVAKRFPGIRLVATGEAEESAELMKNMIRAGVLAILAVYFILVLLLNSLSQPLIILVAIPFGIIGVILAFWLQGLTMGFMALIGILGMSGVVVNDSLIILSFINHLARERGEAGRISSDTILDATQTRLRPVLLTSLTTVVALIPTAYGLGGKDPFVVPMVMAMLWGIALATVLTLLWVPTLYAVGQDVKAGLRLKSREAAEIAAGPAVPMETTPKRKTARRRSGMGPKGTGARSHM
ncbi:MAG: efflux RND transporter permease subunit [candidate division FCPU426 bacterium]